ncbi:protein kinase [Dactylosporangium sucinum]|uniref:serine/threonine-protein kinase n=1 Tax=Dactylosporangium sucinum TaxID=1424081 RepID=UPI00167DB29A|nr:serine/threonine-protein kinase [Dactylosporangium sucinum]
MDDGQLLNGRYRLLTRLAEGGSAEVWRALDEILGRPVAVKVLAARYADDHDRRRRILREARAAARLSHPNVTNVHDYGETPDREPFVVMELLDGPTLAERLAGGPLPAGPALRIGAEIAAGLAAAHAAGLVHRDVKPANIVITPEAVKLVDFGIAGFTGEHGDPDPGTPILGTPAYLAPERLLSDDVTTASDVYSFGVVLHRTLTGRLPWAAATTEELVEAHVERAPEPLPELPGVPAEVGDLVAACLAKSPAERPLAVDAAALLAGLATEPAVGRAAVAALGDPDWNGPTRAVGIWVDPGPDGVAEEFHDRRRMRLALALSVAAAVLVASFALGRDAGPPFVEAGPTADLPTALVPAEPATPPSEDPGDEPGPSAEAGGGQPVSRAGAEGDNRPGNAIVGDDPAAGNPGDPGPNPTTNPPANPPTTAPGAAPTTQAPIVQPSEAPEVTARLGTLGGVVVASCVGSTVRILDVLPVLGADLLSVDRGPRQQARVELNLAGVRLGVTVACRSGAPAVVG